MRGRCLDGHWCLQLPYGYRYRRKQSKNDRAAIERDEPIATIIQNAIEGFASGYLATQAEAARFLQDHAEFPKNWRGSVPDQIAHNILTNPLYAGCVHVPQWDVSLRPGHHPALVSFETFQRVQRRLQGNSKGMVRTDNSADFALRGYVVCACCGTRLTSCWAKGSKGKRYPYYHCREKSCEAYGLSIPRDKIESEFAALLQSLRPARVAFDMVHKGLRQLWQQQDEISVQRKAVLTAEVREVEREAKKLVDRVLETESATLIAAYEKRLFETEARKVERKEQITRCGTQAGSFDNAFRTAMVF